MLDAGRLRIVALGGDCDPLDRLVADDLSLQAADAAIAGAERR